MPLFGKFSTQISFGYFNSYLIPKAYDSKLLDHSPYSLLAPRLHFYFVVVLDSILFVLLRHKIKVTDMYIILLSTFFLSLQ